MEETKKGLTTTQTSGIGLRFERISPAQDVPVSIKKIKQVDEAEVEAERKEHEEAMKKAEIPKNLITDKQLRGIAFIRKQQNSLLKEFGTQLMEIEKEIKNLKEKSEIMRKNANKFLF